MNKMSITDLLLKGGIDEIVDSKLLPGIGKKGAEKIHQARGEGVDILDLISAGTNRSDYQDQILNNIVSEEPRQNIAQLLRNRRGALIEQENNAIMSSILGEDLITDPKKMLSLDPEVKSLTGAGGYIPLEADASFKQGREVISDRTQMSTYDESAHNSANIATATESMSGGTSGNTGGMFDLRDTTSTGFLNAIGGETGGGILAASMLGGLTGGFANMAFGGEFGEGAVMGALAGGGIAIGARAITANSGNIESFMRERVSKAGETGGKMGLMDRGMQAMLKSDNPTLGIQSRHLVMSGGALSGVAFTGRRKDKRRGFNAHRGNRI